MESESLEQFFGKSPEEYGEKYHEHLLEQYKLYVEMTDNVSERRQSANNYFLTVNSILVSLFGVLSGFNLNAGENLWRYSLPLAGLLVSIAWIGVLLTYRQLNSGKFKVIHRLESQLPAALYDAEWKLLGEGRNKKYMTLTMVELLVPLIFSGLYILLMGIALYNL